MYLTFVQTIWRNDKNLKEHIVTSFLFSFFRLDDREEPIIQEKEISAPSESPTNSILQYPVTDKLRKWLSSLIKHPPASGMRTASPGLTWGRLTEAFQIKRRAKRSRGHTHSRGSKSHPQHAQLKRVGCVLGTCQVQNLSHRLYQLMGRNGREESSPVNPRSPHSYGWARLHLLQVDQYLYSFDWRY